MPGAEHGKISLRLVLLRAQQRRINTETSSNRIGYTLRLALPGTQHSRINLRLVLLRGQQRGINTETSSSRTVLTLWLVLPRAERSRINLLRLDLPRDQKSRIALETGCGKRPKEQDYHRLALQRG
jgi:hypothetical protein